MGSDALIDVIDPGRASTGDGTGDGDSTIHVFLFLENDCIAMDVATCMAASSPVTSTLSRVHSNFDDRYSTGSPVAVSVPRRSGWSAMLPVARA